MSILIEREADRLVQSMPVAVVTFVNWSAKFSIQGPRWIPAFIRRVPLHMACFVVKLYVKGYL